MVDSDFGSATKKIELSEAVRLICKVEGIADFQVKSIEVVDEEVRVQFLRGDGHCRTSIYPLAAVSQLTLTPGEQAALSRISNGGEGLLGNLQPDDLHKLLKLRLIRWDGNSWRLTDLGKQHVRTSLDADWTLAAGH